MKLYIYLPKKLFLLLVFLVILDRFKTSLSLSESLDSVFDSVSDFFPEIFFFSS